MRHSKTFRPLSVPMLTLGLERPVLGGVIIAALFLFLTLNGWKAMLGCVCLWAVGFAAAKFRLADRVNVWWAVLQQPCYYDPLKKGKRGQL